MDAAAVTGLVGVALGWLLGVLTDAWRDRRSAQRAGRLVATELLDIAAGIEQARQPGALRALARGGWALPADAWNAHAAGVLSILSADEGAQIQAAYNTRVDVERVVKVDIEMVRAAEQRRETEVGRLLTHLQESTLESARMGDTQKNDRYVKAVRSYIAQEDKAWDRVRKDAAELLEGQDAWLAERRQQFDAAARLVWSKAYGKKDQ